MSILADQDKPVVEAGLDAADSFETISLERLDAADPDWLDILPFGVIGIGANGRVSVYNATEATFAGLSQQKVIDRPFFLAVAPCMNNFMVAQRFIDEPELDAIIDFMLTFRMRPTPVRLRLLNAPTSLLSFVLVQR